MSSFLALIGAALAVIASNLTWVTVSGGGQTVAVSGADVSDSLTQALSFTAVAAWLLLLVVRQWGRWILAGVLAALGIAMIAVAVFRHSLSDEQARLALRAVSLADASTTSSIIGPTLFAAAGIILAASAVMIAVATAKKRQSANSAPRQRSAWEQLDAGLDPTNGSADEQHQEQWPEHGRKDES